ncbi:hypothetical protein NM208_g15294 [Fusarium decemcellulare]|uniref:Uncharacterized protein n=1 Tax=Fusarium decemcellulare TaxID=57161 RepID=A0ACC1RDF6_9HYPO|nr:hypothetical protein NM208_g15294 [Fusarium decemcellulare]
MSMLGLLEQFLTSCLQAYEHRALPFDLLLQNLPGLPRRTTHSPVFQIMVNYQMHGSFAPVDFGQDFRFARYDHFNARNETDFTLDVEEAPDASLRCVFEFDTALYRTSRMDEFARIYSTFVSHIVDCDGQLGFNAVPLVSADDEALIAAVLQPPVPHQPEADVLFDTLFAQAVSRFPDKTAVVDDNVGDSRQELTYAELDLATQTITSTLLRDGAGPGDVVGVSCEPGVAMVLAIYGVLRAGCAYVAVGDAPEERLRGMVTDVGMRYAIVDGTKPANQLVTSGLETSRVYDTNELLSLATDDTSINGKKASSRAVVQKPWALRADDPLCCIFTSGSTGRPKGVYLTHGQVRRWQLGYHAGIEHNANDTLLLASAPTFDLSLASIYGAIARGSTLVVASREARYSGSKMLDVLVDNRVSNLVITPTQFAAVLKAPNSHKLRNWKQLRNLTLGGEIVPHHLVRSFYGLGLPNASVWNLYGPSEATISVSIRRLNLDDDNSPLGPPHSPARMYILDQQKKPVPFGVPGELYIGGPGICTGYIKRPDQTKDAFLPDKFAEIEGLEHASPLMYRTGDLFCLDRDGTLTTRGRIGGDRQVKIRGMRTELDEIEVAIQDALDSWVPAHNSGQIASLAVVYRKDEEMLVGYLATNDAEGEGDAALATTEQQELTRYLRFALQSGLPAHMRPGAYVFVGQLPSTVSGKMDYRAIAAFPPPSQDTTVEESLSSSASSSDLSDVQAEIADTWRQVLPIESTPLLATDDFFSVGGHSLALIQLRAGIVERFGVHLSLTDIFADPSLEGMEKLVLDGLTGTPEHLQNGVSGLDTSRRGAQVDWAAEATLPLELMAANASRPTAQLPMTAVAMTGASTMMGVHVLQRLLTTTNLQVYCLAEPGLNSAESYDCILEALQYYGLATDSVDSAGSLGVAMSSRIHAFAGALSHPTLGLSDTEIRSIDAEVQAIFHLASDVSLFGNVERVRDGNLGAVKFLLGLAQGLWHGGKRHGVPPKAFHYLSSWGVTHLQVWHDTEVTSKCYRTSYPDHPRSLGTSRLDGLAKR